MIIIAENDASKFMAHIRVLVPVLPDYVLEKVNLLEEQISNGYCDEALLVQINGFISQYILKKKETIKKETFFNDKEVKLEEVELSAEELKTIINAILVEHVVHVQQHAIRR